ncbi:unnamed protein product, partial [Rhizoctonia solani]
YIPVIRLLVPLLEHSTPLTSYSFAPNICSAISPNISSSTMHPTTVSVVIDACFAVTCQTCGKTTWKGCGLHVDSVMANVKPEDQCTCPR